MSAIRKSRLLNDASFFEAEITGLRGGRSADNNVDPTFGFARAGSLLRAYELNAYPVHLEMDRRWDDYVMWSADLCAVCRGNAEHF